MTVRRLYLVASTLVVGLLLGLGVAWAEQDGGSGGGASDGAPSARDGGEAGPVKGHASATEVEPPAPRPGGKLVIATKPTPPFAIKNDDGTWTGMSIELWRRVAEELELDFELQETDFQGMLEGLEDGRFDAGVAAITVTAEREAAFDFTHPFFTTGLGIAVRNEPGGNVLGAARALFSWRFARAMGALLLVLLAVGVVVWLLERRRNPEQFGGGPAKGLASGFWFSAVTMTTVGYGDKAPVTFMGRLVTLVWMFVSVVTISGFTAAIASSLTVSQLGSAVSGPDDLPNVRVGCVPDTTSANYLNSEHIAFWPYDTPLDGLRALENDEIDAMVYDHPILRYYSNVELRNAVRVLPMTFERQDYAVGLRRGSPYREEVNRVLLRQIGSLWWQDLNLQYLGRD